MKSLVVYFIVISTIFGEIVRLTNGEFPPYNSKEMRNYGMVSQIVT
jgi:hypothetical protein